MVDIEYIRDNYRSLKINIWGIIKRLWLVERLRFHERLSISGLLDTKKNTFVVGRMTQCMQINLVFTLWSLNKSTFKIKIYRWKWGFLVVENQNKFKKGCYNFSFKKYFFKLCLKTLRFLVRLSVSGVFYSKKLDQYMTKQVDQY